MLAPIDKAESGANDILQIEVTRRCDLFNCSNCTRLLPFRKDPVEMALDVFREAVRSLEGWPGIVALFGGNPCTHQKFAELCAILAEYVEPERRGLWTNSLRGHGELAARTFSKGRLNLNAHGDAEAFAEMNAAFPGRVIQKSKDHASWHSAILVDYRDLGIAEEAFLAAREKCDINQKWSGIIQQRDGRAVGYFCEIAGAIDGTTGERNGVVVFPGWWKERMPTFEHQVRACCNRGCAVPLRLRGWPDIAQVYDVSPSWLQYLDRRTGSVDVRVVVDSTVDRCRETTDYARLRT